MTHIITSPAVLDSIVNALPVHTMCGDVFFSTAFPETASPSDICRPCTVATNEAQRRAL